ncbi:hypothetical protein NS936_02450, partial [Pseudomonas aeruginosa]|nr:hypothetical protein [Pseudomonas aeruginosa]
MIRGLDIPRGRLATLWPLQRTNQARAFDADAEAGSHVAQNEGQEEEVEGLEHAARPVADPDSGAPRGFDRRRSDTDETIGRPTVTEPMSKDIHHADGTALANPGPRRRVQRRQTRPG